MLLAIETSCDETAVAVFDLEAYCKGGASLADVLRIDLVSSQVNKHKPYGGVVPELAAREHVTNLPVLVTTALEQLNLSASDLQAIAVTRGPGLKGCLLVGLGYAKALSFSLGIPLLPVHHMEGHLFSCDLLEDADKHEYPALALVVSGGHTLLVLIRDFRDYTVLATTRDDAAGEAFDKVATLLGLPYPGGPALSKAAESGDQQAYQFPIGMPDNPRCFSFSGFKTAVLRTTQQLSERISDEQTLANLAASAEWGIVESLVVKTREACREFSPKTLLLTGGVAANRVLREELAGLAEEHGIVYAVPPHRWCTDNAAMIGAVALRVIERNPDPYFSWSQNGSLGPEAPFDLGTLPRWPLDES